MSDSLFRRAYYWDRLRANPLGEFIEEFVARLRELGYSWLTVRGYVQALEHFTTWLTGERLCLDDIDKELVRSFLYDHPSNCRCPKPAPTGLRQVRPALNHLLRMLRERMSADASQTRTPIDAELGEYRHHLQNICGLAESTCDGRVRFAREFLQASFANNDLQWDLLKPDHIISFVAGYAARCGPGTVQVAASALRTFLRYLRFHGRCADALIGAVPRIPNWRLAHVPKTMTGEQFEAFLESFDRTTATGRRDYAMALCQVVLGMRACEVAGLLLDDIDWRSGIVRISTGKGLRARELPLTKRVGQAIADYVRRGRPRTDCRNVFVRHRAPRGAVSLAVVGGAMRMAFARAKGCENWKGTHVLRHTAATNLLERGTSLKEISDVLGHRCIETTMIYTKVDVAHLQTVVTPWPEVQP
jgi:site-specific recombinase XerD